MKFSEYLEKENGLNEGIDEKYVQKYFKKFGGSKTDFIDMLQGKAYFAKQKNKKVYAFDRLKDGEELEKMLVIADDKL